MAQHRGRDRAFWFVMAYLTVAVGVLVVFCWQVLA